MESMADLTMEVTLRGERPVVALTGELDINSSPRLKEALLSLKDQGAIGFVLDMAQLTFVDSTGLGTLVAIWNALGSPPGGIRLVAPTPTVARAIKITALDSVFPAHASRDEAMGAVQ
jgi:anti-sigma B factor antagonist